MGIESVMFVSYSTKSDVVTQTYVRFVALGRRLLDCSHLSVLRFQTLYLINNCVVSETKKMKQTANTQNYSKRRKNETNLEIKIWKWNMGDGNWDLKMFCSGTVGVCGSIQTLEHFIARAICVHARGELRHNTIVWRCLKGFTIW